MVAEFIGGYLANSIAVYSDALHMLSDLTGFLINVAGIRLGLRGPTSFWTFGYSRVEVLGAIASIQIVWVMTGVLVYAASNRVAHPVEVDGKVMCLVGGIGILMNIILGTVLYQGGVEHSHFGQKHGHGHEESHGHSHGVSQAHISVQSALAHTVGDFFQNIGVVIAGVMITVDQEKYRIMDPVCTFVFAFVCLLVTAPVLKNALYVLLEVS